MASNAYYGVGHYIKSLRPHYMLVFDADDQQLHRVNNPEIRNRVQRVLTALEGLPWARIEMFDKKDGIIHTYRRNPTVDDPPVEGVEDLGATLSADRELGRISQIIKLVGDQQERSLKLGLVEGRETVKPLLDGILKLHEIGWGKLSLYEKQYEHALAANQKLSHQLAAARAALVRREGETDEKPDELDQLFNALAPELVNAALSKRDDERPRRTPRQAAADRRAKIGRDSREPHTNGVNGAAAGGEKPS